MRELCKLGDRLGTRVAGRAGSLQEVIEPKGADDAHPRSLSARYGLDALPFHTELSHRTRPCRYLLLGCIDPGSSGAATKLLDWRTLGFSSEELDLLEETPVLVRSGGVPSTRQSSRQEEPSCDMIPAALKPLTNAVIRLLRSSSIGSPPRRPKPMNGTGATSLSSTIGASFTGAARRTRGPVDASQGFSSMPDDVFIAINGDALHAKSKVYIAAPWHGRAPVILTSISYGPL